MRYDSHFARQGPRHNQDRQRNNSSNNNNGSNNKPREKAPRAPNAVNLGRLAEVLDFDLLSAGLGVSEETLRGMVDGRSGFLEGPYLMHIVQRLDQIGMPAKWLDQPNAPITPEYLTGLRHAAADSLTKAPIRRCNFKKLSEAFNERLDLLADALELSSNSIQEINAGRLLFDDQRYGHINPRLMAAGFPNGWLESADSVLTDELNAALATYGETAYERELEELHATASQVYVAAVDAVPAAAPIAITESNELAAAPQPVKSKENDMSTREQNEKTSGQKVGGKAGAVGRPVGSNPPVATAATASPSRPPFALGGDKVVGRPIAAVGRPVVNSLPAANTQVDTGTPPELTTGSTGAEGTPPFAQGSDVVSIRRMSALDQLLEESRRGAKMTLWRDILNSSLPTAGNIRRGRARFRDDLVEKTEKALNLPKGWLDNPVFPPPTLAAWVTNKDVPMPTSYEEALAQLDLLTTTTPAAAAEPAASVEPAVAGNQVRKSKKGQTGLSTTPAAQPPAAVEQTHDIASLNRMAANPGIPVVTEPAAAPVVEPVVANATAASAVTSPSGFTWEPRNGQPLTSAAPLATALGTMIASLSAAGSFTEDDALNLINYIMQQQRKK